jgi:hypothetical protein
MEGLSFSREHVSDDLCLPVIAHTDFDSGRVPKQAKKHDAGLGTRSEQHSITSRDPSWQTQVAGAAEWPSTNGHTTSINDVVERMVTRSNIHPARCQSTTTKPP